MDNARDALNPPTQGLGIAVWELAKVLAARCMLGPQLQHRYPARRRLLLEAALVGGECRCSQKISSGSLLAL